MDRGPADLVENLVGSPLVGEVLRDDSDRNVVGTAQFAADMLQCRAFPRDQYQAVATTCEQLRQLQADTAGRACDEGMLEF